MLSFRQFSEEYFIELNEILDSDIDIHKQPSSFMNNVLGDKAFPAHTTMMQTDHMKNNGHSVLRFMNKNKEIEYHLMNLHKNFNEHKLDPKSMLHCLQIIHNDSKSYLDRGNNVKLQASNKKQANNYKKFAKISLKMHGIQDKTVIDKGETLRLDGEGNGHTIMIEGPQYELKDWGSVLRESELEEL